MTSVINDPQIYFDLVQKATDTKVLEEFLNRQSFDGAHFTKMLKLPLDDRDESIYITFEFPSNLKEMKRVSWVIREIRQVNNLIETNFRTIECELLNLSVVKYRLNQPRNLNIPPEINYLVLKTRKNYRCPRLKVIEISQNSKGAKITMAINDLVFSFLMKNK